MKKKINKFAYPCDIEPQQLCRDYPDNKAIFVVPEIDMVSALRVEVYPGPKRTVKSDFLGFDGEQEVEVDGDKTYRISSDVRLILHTKDLAKKYGADFASRMAERFGQASQFQQQLDKLSDDELLNTVRSRHIQSPSEIKSYSEMLLEEAANVRQMYETKAAESQSKADADAAVKTTAAPAATAAVSE